MEGIFVLLDLLIIGGFISFWIYMACCSENEIGMFANVYTKKRCKKLEDRVKELEERIK